MKLITLLLIVSFNLLADVKVQITSDKGSYCGDGCKFKTQVEADAWIADNLSNNSWGKPDRWVPYTQQDNCLETKEFTAQVDDESVPYPDPIPEDYQHPQVDQVVITECKLPKEYTVVVEDITAEVEAEKAAKEAEKLRIDELKLKDKDTMKLDELVELLKLKGII